MKFAVVVSRFNQGITQRLLEGALSAFRKNRIEERSVRVVWVPGAFELPVTARKLASSGKYDAVVCLGCVLQGETPHQRYISAAVAYGITRSSLSTGIPITFGVLTPDTRKQALARSGSGSANKGLEAAEAAIEMGRIFSEGL